MIYNNNYNRICMISTMASKGETLLVRWNSDHWLLSGIQAFGMQTNNTLYISRYIAKYDQIIPQEQVQATLMWQRQRIATSRYNCEINFISMHTGTPSLLVAIKHQTFQLWFRTQHTKAVHDICMQMYAYNNGGAIDRTSQWWL